MNAPIYHGGSDCRCPWPGAGGGPPGWTPPPVWNDIAFVGSSQAQRIGWTVTLDKPVGVVAGDVMIVFLAWGDGINGWLQPFPAGWVRSTSSGEGNSDSSSQSACLIKIATAVEPANYTFTMSWGGVNGILVAYRNCMPLKPVLSSSQHTTMDSEAAITLPECNCIYPRSMVVCAGMTNNPVITGVPALFTQRENLNGLGFASMCVADYLNVGTGVITPGQMTVAINVFNQAYTLVLVKKYAYLTDEPRIFYLPAKLFEVETGAVPAKRTIGGRSVFVVPFGPNAVDVITGHIPLPIQWDKASVGIRLVWFHETTGLQIVRWQIGACAAGNFELWNTAIVTIPNYGGFGDGGGAANLLRRTPERWIPVNLPAVQNDPSGQKELFIKITRVGDNAQATAYFVGAIVMIGCFKNDDLTPNPFNV